MAKKAAQSGVVENPTLAERIRFPGTPVGPLGSVAWRVAVAFLCLLFTSLVVYWGRAGYRDVTGETLTFIDAVYFAAVSLSTTGYGDIVPVSDTARILNILIITPLRIVFLIVLIGSTLEVLTRRTTFVFREKNWRKRVHDHTIIIGFGVKGRSAAVALLEEGTPAEQIVVVCSDQVSLDRALSMNLVAILGNAREEVILKQAGVESAKRVIVAADSDDTSVLITLTVRRLNPTASIVAASRETQNTSVLRQSGANGVIPTSEAVGRLMAMSLTSPTAGELMEDLLDPSDELEVVERPVENNEVGINPTQLIDKGQLPLALVRDGQVFRFDSGVDLTCQQGDHVVVIRHCDGTHTKN